MRVRLILGLLALVLAGCTATPFALRWSAQSAAAAELRAAQARWDARPFARYRAEIKDGPCRYTVEVTGRTITWSTPVRCDLPRQTVDDFLVLAGRDDTVGIACVARGCACRDIYKVTTVYDPVLGYPREMDVRLRPELNYLHRDYWRAAFRLRRAPDCGLMEGQKEVRITLMPLPD